MNEHSLIARYFAPLSASFAGSLNLRDDAAILDIPAGQQLVVTKDAISEGIHFIGNESPSLIAKKLLRTNLSDLAAMGATPLCYFLSIALPKLNESFIKTFVAGLAEDQEAFSIHLAGGDTITTQSKAVLSLTAHGLVPAGQALKRSGAKAGDIIYVSGTLGDAALGLQQLRTGGTDSHLVNRYLLPQPRIALGISLRGSATSCMDISDGLLADMNHICRASNVGAEIRLEQLPLSASGKQHVEKDESLWPLIYAGGDDYELLFTLPANSKSPEGCTAIGTITKGSAAVLFQHGRKMTPDRLGYSHS